MNSKVQLSIKGYSTEFVGTAAFLIKAVILVVVAYAFYKLAVQKTLQITIA